MISTSQVYDFYRIRWQIELVFKLWKSYSGLNYICAWRKERMMTELYAKLIGIVIVYFLLAPLRNPDETWLGREVSPVKFKKLRVSITKIPREPHNSRLHGETNMIQF